MATSDWLNLRGWVEGIVGWSMDNVHDTLPSDDLDLSVTISLPRGIWPEDIVLGPVVNLQAGFAEMQPSLEAFFSSTMICTVVFTTLMLTILPIPYIERKFIGRLMDRLGATTTLRSLWIGESGATAGEWWKQLPFGMGAPIGWLNRTLNSIWGNDHELETVSRVNNRGYHGYWFLLPGFFQAFADFTKFAGKEHIVPKEADRTVYEVAPVIIISTTILVFAFSPFGPHFYVSNAELSAVFMMAIFGVAPLGVFFAGWASNNKYTLIGGMRSAAQLTAYEIPLLITVLGVCVISGSFNVIEIVDFQIEESNVWNLFMMPLGAALFFITMIAEVERIPFDMPEAEAELVEGWWTEYGGLRWGFMFMAEYMRCYAACLLFALFFLGGWEVPFQGTLEALPILGGPLEFLLSLVPGIALILLKAWALFFVFVWIRASLHRVRTDQILEFGWQWLLPLSIVNLAIAMFLRVWVWDNGWGLIAPVVMILTGVLGLAILVVDEDKEALETMRRPYSTYALSKAYPGSHRDEKLEELQDQFSSYSAAKISSNPSGIEKEMGS
ncbi:MAG: complex I subunit 1 family protein [Candidatus Thermoplasmatota archaeon]|nr:complex I subunit 1 family protein [Candidatus Thermoplasmatota archaeon]